MSYSGFSLPWGAFASFKNRYARATKILQELYELSDNEAFSRVRSDRKRFEKFKFLSKCLFAELFSMKSEKIKNKGFLLGLMLEHSAYWEKMSLQTCPKLDKILDGYLTNVKVSRAAREAHS
jgi:hypothetical protein